MGAAHTDDHATSRAVPALEPQRGLVDEKIVCWYFAAALISLMVALLAGFLYSMQFLQHYPLEGVAIFSPGRWRMVHTQSVIYGFLANAVLGALHWVVPWVTCRRVWSRGLSWFLFAAWQGAVAATVAGILLGEAQALNRGETPVWIDPLVLVSLMLAACNFLTPILKTTEPLSPVSWYVAIALVWTVFLYASGNFVPQYGVSGAAAGAVAGVFTQGLETLFAIPIGLGLLYGIVSGILQKPIGIHRLSQAGFWTLACCAPLVGLHRFLHSPIPAILPQAAIVALVVVNIALVLVIINFLISLRGRFSMLRTSLPVRWIYTGLGFLLLACLQSVLEVLPGIQGIVHFTDWEIGHGHLVWSGVLSFWALGIMTFLLPRLMKVRAWYSRGLAEWHYWLSSVSLGVMFMHLVMAGLVQGTLWMDLAPWEHSLVRSYPFWLVRTIAGAGIIVAQFVFLYHIHLTFRFGRNRQILLDEGRGDASASSRVAAGRMNEIAVDSVSTLNFRACLFPVTGVLTFAFGFLVMGLWPWVLARGERELSVEELAAEGIPHEYVDLAERFPERFRSYYGTPDEASLAEALRVGHQVYIGEGCWHCHTQQIRPISNEHLRWEPVSRAGEYRNALQRPALFGARRVGPDLIRAGGRRSNDWHIAHFYKPTSVVPASVMPAYRWFFDEQGYPNKKGMAIITYVQWLGSWREEYPSYLAKEGQRRAAE